MFKSFKAIAVLFLVGISLMPQDLWAQASRTPWQMHEGLEITPENPYGVTPADPFWPAVAPLDPIWYSTAVIPDAADAGWGPAPAGDIIAFGGPSASVIDEAGYSCWQAYDYSYFHTYVTVPENTTLTDFTISFSGMDDGARITIINSAYPAGLIIPGSYVTGGGTATSDLASYVTTGENRVVITQIDVCPNGNTLASAVVVLNGETVVVNNAPVANAGPDQNVPRTGALTDVILDGSGSSDEDAGDVLLYSWTWDGGSASGVSPTISLAAGTHTITLTVDDQNGETGSDDVTIVVDNSPYAQTFTVLGAVGNTGDTDPYIQALPEGATEWSQAYLIGPHPWGQVPGTNSWINFDPDNAVGTNTTTPYRIRFMVPEDASNPSMYFQVNADNRAIIHVNETLIDSIDGLGSITVNSETAGASLHSGLNEIRIALVDWGSIVGINYRIDVTMTSAEDISDAVLTPEDAALLNNAPLADAGEDQAFETVFTTQVVTLDASGSNDPDGNLLSYSWSENGSEIATGENPTLTLTAGMHTITLTAYDGELSDTDEVIVTVTQVAPMVATDPEPAHGATDVPLDQILSWAAVPGATGYRLSLGTDLTLSSIVNYIDLGNVLSYTPESPFTYDNRYDWAVFPYNAAGEASSIPAWTFFTLPAPVPMAANYLGVADGSMEQPLDVMLQWDLSDGATGYYFDLGTDNPPTNLVHLDLSGDSDFYQNPETFDYSTTYYWSVTPYNNYGQAEGVEVWSFTTMEDNTVTEGESCETPYAYGAVNSPAMMGDLLAGGQQWYSFTADGSFNEIIVSLCHSVGVSDPQLAIFTDCGDVVDLPYYAEPPAGAIAHNDDFCGLNAQILLVDLPAGTYTVAVYGYTESEFGAYELEITGSNNPCAGLTDVFEPNDDMFSATPVSPGVTLEAALCPTEDSDFYSISGPAYSTVTFETGALSSDAYTTDTYLNLYDAAGNLLDSDDDGGAEGYTSMISYMLPDEGVIFVEVVVSSWAAGTTFDYTLSVSMEAPPAPVPQNLVATGGDGLVDLTWDPAPLMPLVLRNSDGVSALKTSNPKANLHPAKANLARILSAKQARYQTHLVNSGIRELGDTCGEAYDYGMINSAAMPGDLTAGGQQWYTFSTDGSYVGVTVSLCNSVGVSDPQLAIFTDCGDVVDLPYFAEIPTNALAHNDDACGLNAEIFLPELAAGTYYVAVYGYTPEEFGSYELAITGTSDECAGLVDAYEPNNTMGEATLAAHDSYFDAALCPTDDSDFFAVTGLAGQIITFETMPLSSDEYTTDTWLNLYDPSGVMIDSDDDSGLLGYTSMISYELPSDGTYYFEVVVSSWAAGTVFDYSAHVMIEEVMNDFSFNIYRDEMLMTSGVGMPAYTDLDVVNGTTYCYTVTQILGDESESGHSNVDCATPVEAPAGDVCSDPIALMLPAMGITGSSEGYNNDYFLSDYMSGIDIVYAFSVPSYGTISGSIADAGYEWTAMFILDDCPDGEPTLIAEGSGSSGGSFDHAPIMAGEYYLIVSNWPTPDAFSYSFDLVFEPGPAPMVDLLSPVANMMVSTLTPEFLWQTCPVPYQAPALLIGADKQDILRSEAAEAEANEVDLVTSFNFLLGMTPDLSDAMETEVIGGRFTPEELLQEDAVYFWAVSANNDDGSVFYSDTASFWTNSMNSAPMAFGTIAPAHDALVETQTPSFSWEPATEMDLNDEVIYNIFLGSSVEELQMVYTGFVPGIAGTEFTLIEPIEDNTTYFWRVEARDTQGATTYSSEGYKSFHVNLGNDAPSVVDLVTPDSVLVLSLNPEMYWTSSIDVDPLDVVSYEMHWWGADMVYDSVLTDTHSVILPRALADNSIYYWNVIAMDAHGGMSQSEDAIFWTDLAPEPPMDFALLSPENDATGLSDLPIFQWEVANDPDPMDYANYILEIATDPEFSEIVSTTQTNTVAGFEMTESLPINTEYWWRVTATDSDDLSTVSGINKFTVGVVSTDDLAALPDEYIMQQNYPNPFNPTTTLRYGIPEDANVTLLIYDVRGNLVKTIESGYQPAGWYEAMWNGLSESGQVVSTGLYIARFQAGGYSKVVKMLYLK